MEGKLIEAVRGRLVLYDTSHPDYLKVKFKSQVWEEVAKEIDMKSGKFVYVCVYIYILNLLFKLFI